jgi:PAS domain S-box-containing protein
VVENPTNLQASVADPITDAVLAGIAVISADAIICIDESQVITFYNEGAERIFGYTRAEALGKPIEMLIPARYRAAHHGHVEKFGRSHVPARRMGERSQIAGLRKNGEEFPAEAAISHLGTPGNQVYSVVLRDITLRRRADQAQRFLAEAGEVLASSLGPAETIRSVARLAVPMLADAAVVSAYYDGTFRGVATAHIDPARAEMLRAQREASPPDMEGAPPQADNVFADRVPTSALILPLVAREQLLGVMELYTRTRKLEDDDVALAKDMSRRAALAIDNARLHEQVKLGLQARDDMIGIVAHDLRNPVNAVKMLTGAILGAERDSALPLDVVEYSTIIRQASVQMDSLIRDLLDVTRIEAGRLKLDAVSTDVEELLSDVLRTLSPVAEAKTIALRVRTSDDLPRVEADRERIRQAISNLVGNSVKFSPAGSTIELNAEPRDGEVVISVKDRGPGMNEEQLAHAFDRFWQSRRTDREGAGLGLAITRGIVEAHRGKIWAESREGEGSIFHFTLPQAED